MIKTKNSVSFLFSLFSLITLSFLSLYSQQVFSMQEICPDKEIKSRLLILTNSSSKNRPNLFNYDFFSINKDRILIARLHLTDNGQPVYFWIEAKEDIEEFMDGIARDEISQIDWYVLEIHPGEQFTHRRRGNLAYIFRNRLETTKKW